MTNFLTNMKKPINDKYSFVRNDIRNGDIILYRGDGILAKLIRFFDESYYTHIGIVWKHEGSNRLLTLDMWSNGISLVPLSRRIDRYVDFCVLRPKVTKKMTSSAINTLLKQWDGEEINYDTALLLRIAIIKKTGVNITGIGESDKFICSELVQQYTDILGFDEYSDIKLITPQDFLRHLNSSNINLLFHKF